MVSFIACTSEPKQGEWYESIKTRKRHQVETVLPASFELEQFNKRFEKELKAEAGEVTELEWNVLISHQKLLKMYVREKQNLFYLSNRDYSDYFIIRSQPLGAGFSADEIKRDFIKLK